MMTLGGKQKGNKKKEKKCRLTLERLFLDPLENMMYKYKYIKWNKLTLTHYKPYE